MSCRTPFLTAAPLDESGRCGLCRRGVAGFDAAYSFGSYENELRKLIHVFKYGKVQTLAKPLGKFLGSALPRQERFDAIVPMPMHWRKRWSRGFNQAELLAKELERRTGLPLRRGLKRVHHKAAQAGLTNAKRRANVSGAFQAPKRSFEGRRVLLIDDVMTTGASASACARALKRAGAVHVTLLTVARVDRRIAALERTQKSASALPSSEPFPELSFSGSYTDAKSGSFA